MKKENISPLNVTLSLLVILLSITLLTSYADDLKAQKIHIGNVTLNEKFIQSSIKTTVGGVDVLILCSKNKENKINKIIMLPVDVLGTKTITKLEYTDIMEEISKSLDLNTSLGITFINKIVTIIFNRIDYEVSIKTEVIPGTDDLFLTVIVTKL